MCEDLHTRVYVYVTWVSSFVAHVLLIAALFRQSNCTAQLWHNIAFTPQRAFILCVHAPNFWHHKALRTFASQNNLHRKQLLPNLGSHGIASHSKAFPTQVGEKQTVAAKPKPATWSAPLFLTHKVTWLSLWHTCLSLAITQWLNRSTIKQPIR